MSEDQEPKKPMTVMLPLRMIEKIKRIAMEHGVTSSEVVRKALTDFMNDEWKLEF